MLKMCYSSKVKILFLRTYRGSHSPFKQIPLFYKWGYGNIRSPFHNIVNMNYGIFPYTENIYAIYSIKSNN